MPIEKERLFKQAMDRRPPTIMVAPVAGFPVFVSEPDLRDLYRAIENACEPNGEYSSDAEWIGLANVSFYHALAWVAEQSASHSASECHVRREEVMFAMFDEQMRLSLSDKCWVAESLQNEEKT